MMRQAAFGKYSDDLSTNRLGPLSAGQDANQESLLAIEVVGGSRASALAGICTGRMQNPEGLHLLPVRFDQHTDVGRALHAQLFSQCHVKNTRLVVDGARV